MAMLFLLRRALLAAALAVSTIAVDEREPLRFMGGVRVKVGARAGLRWVLGPYGGAGATTEAGRALLQRWP